VFDCRSIRQYTVKMIEPPVSGRLYTSMLAPPSWPLRFLDGLTPKEAMEQVKIHKQLPIVVRDFRQSVSCKRLLEEYPPKSAIVLQSVLWERYGQRLFELFDLRRPGSLGKVQTIFARILQAAWRGIQLWPPIWERTLITSLLCVKANRNEPGCKLMRWTSCIDSSKNIGLYSRLACLLFFWRAYFFVGVFRAGGIHNLDSWSRYCHCLECVQARLGIPAGIARQ